MGNSRFSDGFLLGALIGGGLALLFTTKKGNKILKVVSEEGFEGLNKFIEEASEGVDNYVEKKAEEAEVEGFDLSDQDAGIKETNGESHEVVKQSKPHKRFFRRNK